MLIRKIGILILTALIGGYLIFAYVPVIFIGAVPLYYISNHDNISHNITVEIFDEQNQTVFLEKYTLNSYESVRFKRIVNWDVPFTSSFVT